MFLRRQGFRFTRGRGAWLAFLPGGVQRGLSWLYWDVWYASWLSYRMTTNPRTVYLGALVVCSVIIAGRGHR